MAYKPLELPGARKRRYVFALTPLADAMFQLLIFFMLSSSLSPYSLLTLRSGPGTGGAASAEQIPDPASIELQPAATWTVENGDILANGQRFGFDSLPQLADVLMQAETPRLLLITTTRAQVQDLVTVLEVLAASGIVAVQIVGVGPS